MVCVGILFCQGIPHTFLDCNPTPRHFIFDGLEEHVVPSFEQHPRIVQPENAVERIFDYRHAESVSVLPWPAFSPDPYANEQFKTN